MSKQDRGNARGVGYGKPPVHTRFKRGQSGNPKGRPKGVNNLRSDVKKTLKIGVTVNDQGVSRRASTQEAALLRLRDKALKGDTRSLDRLLALAGLYNDEAPPPDANQPLSIDDDTIIEGFLARSGLKRTDDSAPSSGTAASTPATSTNPTQTRPAARRPSRKATTNGSKIS